MERFDVYPMPGRGAGGYVVDVQSDLMDVGTRVVIPLLQPGAAPSPARDLNPIFDIAGAPHVMVTQFIASVSQTELRHAVTSLAGRSDDITRAIDILLSGF